MQARLRAGLCVAASALLACACSEPAAPVAEPAAAIRLVDLMGDAEGFSIDSWLDLGDPQAMRRGGGRAPRRVAFRFHQEGQWFLPFLGSLPEVGAGERWQMALAAVPLTSKAAVQVQLQLEAAPHAQQRFFALIYTPDLDIEQLTEREVITDVLSVARAFRQPLKPEPTLADTADTSDGRVTLSALMHPARAGATLLVFAVGPPSDLSLTHVELTELSPRASWHRSAQRLNASPYALRVSRDQVDAEALVVYAPGALHFEVDVPSGQPRLKLGAAVFWARDQRWTLRAEVQGGEQLLTSSLELTRKDGAWTPLSLDLGPVAGQRARVSLIIEASAGGEASGGRSKPTTGAMAAFAAPVIESPAVGRQGMDHGQPAPRPDVVFISLDTVRADRTSLYGNERVTTPHLDQLGAEGLVFENLVSVAPWTLPSHVSILSGQYPDRHGVYHETSRLPPDITWLPEQFRAAGYETLAFTGDGFLNPRFGFPRGFEQYGNMDPACPPMAWAERRPQADGVDQLARARRSQAARARLLDALRAERGRPLFLFAHTYQAHEYRAEPDKLLQMGAAPDDLDVLLDGVFFSSDGSVSRFQKPQMTEAERAALQREAELIYDAALLSADELVGDIVAALREVGRLDSTWIIVTSDHGEALLERGQLGHSKSVYEELLHVPLVIRGPGLSPGRVSDIVSLVDLAPTLRELCGLDSESVDSSLGRAAIEDGRSLAPLFRGQGIERRTALARGGGNISLGTFRALRGPDRKLIVVEPTGGAAQQHLFDLSSDPAEAHDLLPGAEAAAAPLAQRMDQLVQALEALRGVQVEAEMTPELIATLKALGYLE